jgi:hypothetical protein
VSAACYTGSGSFSASQAFWVQGSFCSGWAVCCSAADSFCSLKEYSPEASGSCWLGSASCCTGLRFFPTRWRRGGLAFLLIGVGALQLGVAYLFGGDLGDLAYDIGLLMLGLGGLLYGLRFQPDGLRRGGLPFLLIGVGGLEIGVVCLLDADAAYGLGFVLLGAGRPRAVGLAPARRDE